MTTPRNAPSLVDARALLELAGFALCHGVWTLRDGAPLPPTLLMEGAHGRALAQVPAESHGDALIIGRGNIESLGTGLRRSAIVYDGYVREGGEPVDCVIVEARVGGHPEVVTVVQRYRPADHPEGFAILGRPLFGGRLAEDQRVRAEGFIDRGIGQHPAAVELWSGSWLPDAVDLRRSA